MLERKEFFPAIFSFPPYLLRKYRGHACNYKDRWKLKCVHMWWFWKWIEMSSVVSQLNVFNFSQSVTKILSMELYNEKHREASAGYIYEPPSLSSHFSSGIEAVSGCVMLTTLTQMYIFFKSMNMNILLKDFIYLTYY